ncbi:NADH-cytochrome b5 reductase 1 [Tanacetum coccineum]
MDFLEAKLIQAGLAVFVLAVVATAAYIYSTRKTKVVGSIDPESFKEFKLVKRTQLNHNVAKFRFALPTPTSVLGHKIGQFITCRGKDSQGVEVIKRYHPITIDTDVGYFELVVKMYPQGRMSHHFRQMREGDYLEVKGPESHIEADVGMDKIGSVKMLVGIVMLLNQLVIMLARKITGLLQPVLAQGGGFTSGTQGDDGSNKIAPSLLGLVQDHHHLEELCEKHYEKLLPIMANKYEYEQRKKEKLEEVKAWLDFGEARKKSTRAQESAYSESRTMSPRR